MTPYVDSAPMVTISARWRMKRLKHGGFAFEPLFFYWVFPRCISPSAWNGLSQQVHVVVPPASCGLLPQAYLFFCLVMTVAMCLGNVPSHVDSCHRYLETFRFFADDSKTVSHREPITFKTQ
jgi:hypothetical protein